MKRFRNDELIERFIEGQPGKNLTGHAQTDGKCLWWDDPCLSPGYFKQMAWRINAKIFIYFWAYTPGTSRFRLALSDKLKELEKSDPEVTVYRTCVVPEKKLASIEEVAAHIARDIRFAADHLAWALNGLGKRHIDLFELKNHIKTIKKATLIFDQAGYDIPPEILALLLAMPPDWW